MKKLFFIFLAIGMLGLGQSCNKDEEPDEMEDMMMEEEENQEPDTTITASRYLKAYFDDEFFSIQAGVGSGQNSEGGLIGTDNGNQFASNATIFRLGSERIEMAWYLVRENSVPTFTDCYEHFSPGVWPTSNCFDDVINGICILYYKADGTIWRFLPDDPDNIIEIVSIGEASSASGYSTYTSKVRFSGNFTNDDNEKIKVTGGELNGVF